MSAANAVQPAHAIQARPETISYVGRRQSAENPLFPVQTARHGYCYLTATNGITVWVWGGVMRLMKGNRKIVLVLVSLFLLSALPTIASAQGRGRGRGQDKKIDKFINGHDARDGRWDGRGPRGTRVGHRNRWGNSIFVPRHRRWEVDRNRDEGRNDFLLDRRHNRTDRFERRQMRRHWRREDFRRR